MSDMRIAPGSGRPRDDADSAAEPTAAAATGPAGAEETAPATPATWTTPALWRRPDVVIPAALLAVFLVLLALVLARPDFLTHADQWIRDRVQSVSRSPDLPKDSRPRWPLIKDIADLGGAVPALPVLGVIAIAAALLRRSWRPMLAGAAAYAILGGVVLALKSSVERPGPGQLTLPHGNLGYFPSGHTADTLMCYGTCALLIAGGRTGALVGRRARALIAAGMTVLALSVGFALVWLDYHWVSDVLGSYALCGAALFGVAAILGFHAPGRKTAAPAAESPTTS